MRMRIGLFDDLWDHVRKCFILSRRGSVNAVPTNRPWGNGKPNWHTRTKKLDREGRQQPVPPPLRYN